MYRTIDFYGHLLMSVSARVTGWIRIKDLYALGVFYATTVF